ncbi:AAA family ATPase [Paenibacillus ihumii]|uniref:AAA family ATPase n=1 Tax=Paenibacillus ihumii TaxID=687436 RepID=UPI0006D862BC|nr:AAA family ATPase [Paenibacillus ihumii]
MRLDKLQVSGFGHLSGLELEFKGPVTVLYGPNEAGKSTLLGFVRAMLFGIPSRTYGSMRYEPTRGGAHGGQLAVRGDEGDRWVIERYALPPEGRPGGSRSERLRITRTDAEGRLIEAAQEEMQRELLGGMSSDMFKQLFAISLTELQEVAALQSEELNRFLFHAGIGGGAAVLRGEKKLSQEMDKLYRPRGRTQEMARLLQGYERLRQEAEAAGRLLPRYNEVLGELERVMDELAGCEAERAACGRELAELSKASLIRQDWLVREQLRAELQSLPYYEAFPEEGSVRWNALQEEKERLLLDRAELARRIEALSAEMGRLAPNTPLLAKAEEVRSLHGQLAGYEARVKDMAELRTELRSLRRRLAECLRSIDASWTERELASFAGTVGEREAVRRFGARFSAYDKEMELLHSERYKLEQEAAAAKEAYTAAMSRLEESEEAGRREFTMLVPRHPDEIRRAWSELSFELDRWHETSSSRLKEAHAREAEALAEKQMQGLYRNLLAASSVLTVILPGAIWLSSSSVWGTLAAFTGLAGLDAYLWLGMSRSARSKHRSGLRRLPGADAASETDARLRGLLARLVADPLAAAGRSGEAHGPLQPEDWDRQERELRQLMEAALDVFRLAEQGREQLSRIEQAEARLSMLTEENAAFEREARAIFGELSGTASVQDWPGEEQAAAGREESESAPLSVTESGRDTGPSEQRIASLGRIVIEAKSQLAAAEQIQAERDSLSSKLETLKGEIDRLHDRLKRIGLREQELLLEGGAASGEEFLRRSAEVRRRAELEREIRQLETVMFSGCDSQTQGQLEELLSSCSEEELKDRLLAAEKAMETKERAWRELQERRGRLLQEQEALEQRGRQEDVNQKLAEQLAALRDSLDKYAVMAVCQELISRARRVYEEERQPEVLRLASAYLRTMTGGRYERIVLKMGSQELLAEHRDYGAIGSGALSRGTAEQLYLSMRLALADAVSHHRSIPLLLDDLLVNFDAARMQGAISVLKEVALKRQMIMMTCHAHVVEGIAAQIPEAQIINLG